MKLREFRVRDFRSVNDSGWIEFSDVTALIGTNESGKTNLLLPLWKFNPARDGEIQPTQDYPRARFNEIRQMESKPVFIETRFETTEALRAALATATQHPAASFEVVEVARDYDKKYRVSFPGLVIPRTASKANVLDLLTGAQSDIAKIEVQPEESNLAAQMRAALTSASAHCSDVSTNDISAERLSKVRDTLAAVNTDAAPPTSATAPLYRRTLVAMEELVAKLSVQHPSEREDVRTLVVKALPKFVYYHQYGNLDSEIFLPQVIQNLKRDDLSPSAAAKARTLRVLFEFVRLKAEEILELGKDDLPPDAKPEHVKEVADQKTMRSVLLQSASADLTRKFRDWWKQGEYRFRFEADGNHFRIWVSDDRRPEEIELEGRSTGLLWFLSFYLVFLVESSGAHAGCILLLDEPGLSLHPLSQRDLSFFFDSLSKTNQLAYTTHSPFLVDSDHLDRVKAVYVGSDGHTKVSVDLRAGFPKDDASKSIYPVHAAIGLSASDGLLQGAQSVVVEGPADQLYLSAIKTALISRKKINPSRDLIFIPAGGVKGVRAVAGVVTAKNDEPPIVILDSDSAGRQLAAALKQDLYRGVGSRILDIGSFVDVVDAEVEDLWPTKLWADAVAKAHRTPEIDEDFSDVCKPGVALVPQAEEFAKKHGIKLEQGWKVDIARSIKLRFLRDPGLVPEGSAEEARWVALFERLLGGGSVGITSAAAATSAAARR